MKKLYLLIVLIVAACGAHAQILEHNNAIQKNLRNESMLPMRPYYTEQSNFVRDTSGDALFQNAMKFVADPGKADNGSIRGGIYNTDTFRKLQYRKKLINASLSARLKKPVRDRLNMELRAVDGDIFKLEEDFSKKLSKGLTLANNTRDTIDTLLLMNNNMELSILQIIESIRFYKSKLDSTKFISAKGELTDSIVYLLSNLILMNNNREHLETNELEARKEVLRIANRINANDLSDTGKVKMLRSELISHFGELNKLKERTKHYDSTWRHFFSKYVKNKPAKPVDVAALPFFSTIPGMKDINGSINIIGSSIINDTGSYIEFGLFTGILKSSDSTNAYNVLISEVSNYAFYFKWNYGFESIAKNGTKKIALNTELFYANKAIGKDTSLGVNSNFNSSVFHGKLGIGFIIIKDLFSGYVNGNALVAVTNKNLFDRRFKSNSDILGYPDFGFKMLLSTNMKIPDGLKLYFDLNFLVNTDELKNFNSGSNDILIPNFRVGLRANLGNL